jgi:RNA polymerase sigma factor (TIGR02999 family)
MDNKTDETERRGTEQEARAPEAEALLSSTYQHLRRLAATMLARERPGQTLQATALVHEAWQRIQDGSELNWQNERHFVAVTAEAMRRILVDNARRKNAVRHGGGLRRTRAAPEELPIVAGAPDEELLEVDEVLDALAAHDARKAELVKLRYFVGLTLEEAGATLGLSERTAKRDWAYARAWLRREIARQRTSCGCGRAMDYSKGPLL